MRDDNDLGMGVLGKKPASVSNKYEKVTSILGFVSSLIVCFLDFCLSDWDLLMQEEQKIVFIKYWKNLYLQIL